MGNKNQTNRQLVEKELTDTESKIWSDVPPWIFIGAVLVLLPICAFVTIDNINRQKENGIRILLEKGAALIRSFEAGTRTGIMGDLWGTRQLQKLLFETAQQPDIEYLYVSDSKGTIIAHSNPGEAGKRVNIMSQGKRIDPQTIIRSKDLFWHLMEQPDGRRTLVMFRKFSPTGGHKTIKWKIAPYTDTLIPNTIIDINRPTQIIFVGLDMASVDAAWQIELRDSIITGVVLLLTGFAGVVILFMIQGYRYTRTSLVRIKAFSGSVVDNMPIGLVALDRNMRCLSFNSAGKEILSLSNSTKSGVPAIEVVPQDLYDKITLLSEDRTLVEAEVDCYMTDGSMVPLEISATYLKDEGGRILGYICLFKDLSELKSLKQEIARSQRLVSVGKLAAGVAHEIRNPLSSIKGFATYFKERYQNIPEDQNIAEIMINEVDRLNRVVGQLLEFARPISISMQMVDVASFLTNSLTLIEPRAKAAGVEINYDIEVNGMKAVFDPDKISQVLLNLFINAIDAMPDGGDLAVSVSAITSKNMLMFTVIDTGIGIKEMNVAHIFDPYFTTKSSGTGLGLAISHNIVEAHQGKIKIISKPEKGTAITVCLPIKNVQNNLITKQLA